MSRWSDIIEYYGMTPDEIYGGRRRGRLCVYCETLVCDEDLDAREKGWWRVEAFARCHECRREHLRLLLKEWRDRSEAQKIA